MSAMDMMVGYADTSTRRVAADNAIEYAYRELGDGDVPLVLLQHFRGNLDNWAPALVDALAADRRVVTFDNLGVGATTGSTPNTVEATAQGAIAFLEASFAVSRFIGSIIAMIDRHYGHLARDSREHAVALLDALALERAVDAAWTSNRSANALSNSDSKPYRRRTHRRVDARWTPQLVLVASGDNERS
jgi:pimeloyl-ACP methyl ester carboxylesterase